MTINISQMTPSSSPAARNVQTQQAQSGGAGGFQQLVEQIGQTTPSGGESGKTAAEKPIAAIADNVLPEGGDIPTAESLLDAIEALLNGLEQPGEEDDAADAKAEPEDELLEALDQMNALLALFGGEPIMPAVAVDGIGRNSQESLLELKGSLQESLLELQSIILQGGMKQVGALHPNELILKQLQAMQSLLNGDAALEEQALSGQVAEPLVAGGDAQTVASPQTASYLQRLTLQTSNLSVLKTAAEQQATAGEPAEEQAGDAGTAPIQAPAAFANAGRQAAALVAGSPVTGTVSASQFAHSMSEFMVQKFDLTSANGVMEAKLQLTPEHLGKLDLQITVQNGQLTAVFHAESAAAKDMLDNQMSQLKAALQSQGLTVDRLEVWQGEPASYLSDNNGERGSRDQSFYEASAGDRSEAVESDFEEELAEQEAIRHLGYGRAINATA